MSIKNILLGICLLLAVSTQGQNKMKLHLDKIAKSETPFSLQDMQPLPPLRAAAPALPPSIFDYSLRDFKSLGSLVKPTSTPSFLVKTDPKSGAPIFIHGSLQGLGSEKLEEQAFEYLTAVQNILHIDDASAEFSIVKKQTDASGTVHLRVQQMHRGIPVYGAELMLHATDGQINVLNGRAFPTPNLTSVEPKVTQAAAVEIALQDVSKKTRVKQLTPAELKLIAGKQAEATLVVYHKNRDPKAAHLAWAITLRPNIAHQWAYFVDAETGKIVHHFSEVCRLHHHLKDTETPAIASSPPNPLPPLTAIARDLSNVNRTLNVWREGDTLYLIDAARSMFNAARSNFPDNPQGVIWTIDGLNVSPSRDNFVADHVRSINNQWNTAAAVSAHYNAGKAHEYYEQTFGRNSINGQGGNIISLINIADEDGGGLDNAFWNGAAMFYGNGRAAFEPLAKSIDVAGHEMTHGVIQNEANLEYQDEPGALNESFADIFGAMMDREDWKLGEDVVRVAFFPSGALRDMADPHNGGSSLNDNGWQPESVSEQYRGSEDNGGVHINSGITNRAYYLFATAVGLDVAEQIYYDVLSNYLVRSSQFIDLRLAVIEVANKDYNQTVVNAAANAFDAVGIVGGQGSEQPTDVSVNSGNEFILYSNGNQTTLSLNTPAGQVLANPLTNVGTLSKPSVTDDGTIVVYVAQDQTLRALTFDWNNSTFNELTLSAERVWRNAVISKDGNRLAAITNDFDNRVFIFDFSTSPTRSQVYELFNPTFTQGVSTGDVVYSDAMEFDFSGEFLMYDALNSIDNGFGNSIEYWDIGLLQVWNNNTDNFGDGNIQKLFTGLPEDISVGNPTFSKNSPSIVAFDYVDFFNENYFIRAVNVQTGDIGTIWQNLDIGYPSYSVADDQLLFDGFTGQQGTDRVVAVANLAPDKINGTNSANVLIQGDFSGARWGVWFANGQRVLTDNKAVDLFDQKLEIFPNPFQEIVYLRGESAKSSVLQIEVFDQLGQRVQQQNTSIGTGEWQESLSLRNIPIGTYVIRVSDGASSVSRKILKLK